MNPPDPFDVDALRLPADDRLARLDRTPRRPPRHPPGGKFLRGPVPWDWLQRAGRLPGKALLIGLLLWKEAGCERCRTVRFRLAQAAVDGIHPDTARRGLRRLEAAGLVLVERPPGRCPTVTLLETPAEPDKP
jgi:hypothetical protein